MPLDPAGAVPPRRSSGLYRWLSAPLLIAVAVALLVNYVIPRIAEKSENHRRALEIKTLLVGDVSRSVAGTIVSARFVAGDVIKKESGVEGQQRFYDTGLREWETKRAELQSQIDAYFPKAVSGREWRGLAAAVGDLYTLAGSGIPDRALRMERIRDYLVTHRSVREDGNIDWDALVTDRPGAPPRSKRDNHFRAVYRTVGEFLLRHTDAYVADVLDADLSGF